MKKMKLTHTAPPALPPAPAPCVAPPAPEATVENFEVVAPWVLVRLPIKPQPYAALSPAFKAAPETIGSRLHASALRFFWSAQDGKREDELEALLLRADFEITPAPRSRKGESLEIAMPLPKWETLKSLAEFYGTSAASLCHALLAAMLTPRERAARHASARPALSR